MDERAPLLSPGGDLTNPKADAAAEDASDKAYPSEPRPAYAAEPSAPPLSEDHRRRVVCEVCRTSLTYRDRPGLRVVRCSRCQEATPVGPPPPGKRYLRCACHCLLTCSASSRLVACPRQNCKRTVRITPTVNVVSTTSKPFRQMSCPRCQVSSTWTPGMSVRRCYVCNDRMVLSRGLYQWAIRRARIFFVLGLVFLAVALGVTIGTYETTHTGVYVVYVGGFVTSIILFIRAAMYFFTAHSAPVE